MKIPRVVHQSHESIDRVDQGSLEAREAFMKRLPGYEHRFYNNEDRKKYIEKHRPEVASAYSRLKPGAFRADLFRYVVLYTEGGVWLDIPYGPADDFKSEKDLLPEDDLDFVSAIDTPTFQPAIIISFMMARPRLELFNHAILAIKQNVDNDGIGVHHPLEWTSTILLGKVWMKLYGTRPRPGFSHLNKSFQCHLYTFHQEEHLGNYDFNGTVRDQDRDATLIYSRYSKQYHKKRGNISTYYHEMAMKGDVLANSPESLAAISRPLRAIPRRIIHSHRNGLIPSPSSGMNPGYEHCWSSPEERVTFLQCYMGERVCAVYDSLLHPDDRQFLFSVCYLYHMGGWWLGSQLRFAGDIDARIPIQTKFVCFAQPDSRCKSPPCIGLSHDIIGAHPGSPIMASAIEMTLFLISRSNEIKQPLNLLASGILDLALKKSAGLPPNMHLSQILGSRGDVALMHQMNNHAVGIGNVPILYQNLKNTIPIIPNEQPHTEAIIMISGAPRDKVRIRGCKPSGQSVFAENLVQQESLEEHEGAPVNTPSILYDETETIIEPKTAMATAAKYTCQSENAPGEAPSTSSIAS